MRTSALDPRLAIVVIEFERKARIDRTAHADRLHVRDEDSMRKVGTYTETRADSTAVRAATERAAIRYHAKSRTITESIAMATPAW